MAAKILANLIVMGSGILIRAFTQAYRQALASSWTSVAVLAGRSFWSFYGAYNSQMTANNPVPHARVNLREE